MTGAAADGRGPDTVADRDDPPRLIGIELRVLELQLRRAVGTAVGTHAHRPVLFARALTEDGEGWGECGALPEGTSVDPPLAAVTRWAAEQAVPRLLTAAGVREAVAPPAAVLARMGTGHPEDRMAGAMLEMALLDLELRRAGRSLATHLGVVRRRVPVGAVVGIPVDRDLGALLDAVDEALDPAGGGAARLRLKIAPGWDVAPVHAVRRAHPALALQVDANGAYRYQGNGAAAVERLAALDPFELTCIEQPLPAADLAALGQLAAVLRTPVCLDESLRSRHHVRSALRYGAMGVACLKPSRLGGLHAAAAALGDCATAGVAAFVGGFFETGLGRCANLALAGLAGFTIPGDLTSPDRVLDSSPFGYPLVDGGLVEVPDGPGIGAPLDGDRLEACTVWREWFAQGAA